jgi:hypothetical protein
VFYFKEKITNFTEKNRMMENEDGVYFPLPEYDFLSGE